MENRLIFEKKELSKYVSKVLGVSGENEQETLVFLFGDGFIDGTCYLELEFPGGRKYSIETKKDKENECYKLEVKNSLLKKDGLIRMQLKIVNGTGVWKSIDFEMHVLEAINAVESIEDDYPSFVERIEIRAQEIETGFEQLDEKVKELEGKEEMDPTVPSCVKEITQENINDWNGKSDFSGNYEDLKNKPQNLATESFVEEKISEIEMAEVDLTDYVKKEEVSGLIDERIGSIATALDEINGVEV